MPKNVNIGFLFLLEKNGKADRRVGRDRDALRWTGKTLHVGDLAEHSGFTDTDGRQTNFYREVLQKMAAPKKNKRRRKQR